MAAPPTTTAVRGQTAGAPGGRPAARRPTLLAVFVGGALGTLARAALTRGLPHDPGAWPWATFAANLLGAFLLGWWATRVLRSPDVDPRARPFLATGVCGGLTTFSTLQLELVTLLRGGDAGLAAGYAATSIVLGLVAVLAGRAAARRVPRGQQYGSDKESRHSHTGGGGR